MDNFSNFLRQKFYISVYYIMHNEYLMVFDFLFLNKPIIVRCGDLSTGPKDSEPEIVKVTKTKPNALEQFNLGIYPFYSTTGKANTKVVQNPIKPIIQSIQKVIQDFDSQSLHLLLPLIKFLPSGNRAQVLIFIDLPKLFLQFIQLVKLRIFLAYHIKSSPLFLCQILLRFQNDPPTPFQLLTLFLTQLTLNAPSSLINLLAKGFLNMKSINDNLCLWDFLSDRIKIAIPHINGYPSDFSSLLVAQALKPFFDLDFTTLLQDTYDTATTQITNNHNILSASFLHTYFINAYLLEYPSPIGFYLPTHGPEEYPLYSLIGQTQKLSYLLQGIIAGQSYYPLLKPLGIVTPKINTINLLSE